MALLTRKQIRRLVCETDFGEILYGTATSGDFGFLIDTEKLKTSIDISSRIQNSWVSLTNDDDNEGRDRRVASFLSASGRVNFDNVLPEAVAAGDEYEIHDILSPTQWNKVIDDALSRCARRGTILVTPVEGQLQYDLRVADPTLELADDVMHVIKRTGEAGSYREVELPPYAWSVEDDGDSIYLKLTGGPINPDTANSLVIAVRAILPYSPLTSDSSTTSCPIAWLRSAIVVSAFELYGRTIEAGARGAININQQQAAANFSDQTARYAPQFERPIQVDWS
jgi:hypothetical protein